MDIKKLEQIITEDKLSKSNLYFKLKEILPFDLLDTIIVAIGDCHYRRNISEDLEEIAVNLVVAIMLIDDTDLLTCVASRLANRMDLPRVDAVATSAALLAEVAKETSIISFSIRRQHIVVTSNVTMSNEVRDIIIEGECLPPFIVRPKKVVNNFNSGHITIAKDLLLSKHDTHAHKQNLFYINNMNNIGLSLSKYILGFLEEPTKLLTKSAKATFDYHIAASNKAYAYVLNHDNEMFLSHNYDTRGRTYCDNWMVNYQGTDYKKALVHLTKKEIITC